MIRSRKIYLLFFLILFVKFYSFAQGGFGVGYNVGQYTTSLRNMEILTYEFNKTHPNYTKPYNFINTYRGYTAKIWAGDGILSYDFVWSNKVIMATAIGADSIGDTIFKRQVKLSLNTLSMGFFYRLGEVGKIGMDFDLIGICSIVKKVGPEDNFKDEKWKRMFNSPINYQCGFTLFAEFGYKFVFIRPYYQFFAWPAEFKKGNLYALTLKDYAFNLNNFGVALYVGFEAHE